MRKGKGKGKGKEKGKRRKQEKTVKKKTIDSPLENGVQCIISI